MTHTHAGTDAPECMTCTEWWNGRKVYATNHNICVHGVGTTPGFWCGGCMIEYTETNER